LNADFVGMATQHYRLFLFFYLITFCSVGSAQDRVISFRHLSSNDGLANNNVNCFTQDQWGYIWIGTANGLSCYDAYSFKNFSTIRNGRNGLVSSNIQALLCDSSNNIWIGTASGGLSVLDRKTGSIHAYHLLTHNARFNDVYAITQTRKGEILLGTNIGLFIAHGPIDQLAFTSIGNRIIAGSIPPIHRINCFSTDHKGRIWIGSETGSIHIMEQTGDLFYIHDFRQNLKKGKDNHLAGVQALCISPDNNLWLATWGDGIQYFNISSSSIDSLSLAIEQRKTFNALPDITIGTDLALSQNIIYATTWNQGLVVYNTKTDSAQHWHNTNIRNPGLVTNDLFSVFADKDGNIWIGASRFGGISLYSWKSQMVEHYELGEITENSLDRNRVYALEGDCKGNIYIGGVGGIFRFHNSKLQFKDIPFPISNSELQNFKVLSVEYDKYRQLLWAGSDGTGLFNYNPRTKNFNHFQSLFETENSLSNNSIHEIYMGIDGVIWIGSWGGGLDSYNPETNIFRNHKLDSDESSVNAVLDITSDKYGNLWLATMGKGIIMFNKSESKMYHQMITDKYGNIPQNYYFVYHDDNEDIWAACLENGLVHYNPHTKETDWHNLESGMEFGHISGIEATNDSTLLINTDKGVYITDKKGNIADQYRFTDNLTPMTFWNESSWADQLNWVYLAGDKGLLRYNPAKLRKDTITPKPQITCFELFNTPIYPNQSYNGKILLSSPIESTSSIELKHWQNSIAITFSAMDYTNSKNNIYSYLLEGFDKQWHKATANERKAVYTNLPSGSYTFNVKATNSDGIWNSEIKTLNIVIATPFWKRIWFYFILSALFILFLTWFIKFRQKQLLTKNRLLKIEVHKRTKEIDAKNKELKNTNSELQKHSELLNISNEQIKRQKELLEYQHKEINASISYAKGLQQSLLPSPSTIRKFFPDSFIMYRPKEAVSGDFYWTFSNAGYSIFLTADCTGHGIPGAMVSMLGISFFNTMATVGEIANAADVVNNVAKLFNKTFCNIASKTHAKDSMDMSICVFDKKNKTITFSGILNHLYLARDGKLTIYPASRTPLSCENKDKRYSCHKIDYVFGDILYLFSDGYQDQFGGPENKKFKTKNFKDLLSSISELSIAEQERKLNQTFASWLFNGNSNKYKEQTDDVLVAGIRITESIFEKQ